MSEPFSYVTHCHCEFCKRIAGGYGTVSGRAPTEAIRVIQGEELLRSYTPDGGSAKTFCSTCGSNLFGGGWPESETSSVRLSSFGLDYDRKPEAHTFVRSVAGWEILPEDGLPRYEIRAT
ncbi:MAG: GFA family protein [Gaiellaceae bacterium]